MRTRNTVRPLVAALLVAPVMAAAGGLVLSAWTGNRSARSPAPSAWSPGPSGPGQAPAANRCPPPSRGGGLGAGPNDAPIVDAAAADRGRKTYAAQCVTCHGSKARGTAQGPNLVRSLVVLHDRCGSDLEPFLDKGHPMQSGTPSASLTTAEVTDLAHFLRQRVNDMMRGSPTFDVQDILIGDASAGEAFFTGPGRCATCHSTTGDLAGIGRRLSPVNIQQRFLFPFGSGRGRGRGRGAPQPLPSAVTVTVTPQGGAAVSGELVQMDDFTVALRDADGAYHSFTRTPSLTVEKTVPLAAHIALLDTITDRQVHDVVAYLETLK